MDPTAQLLEDDRARSELLLNTVRAVVVGLLAAVALVYAPRLTPALRHANAAVVTPMLLWTLAQEFLIHRRKRRAPWLSTVNALLDVTAVSALLAGYGLAYSSSLLVSTPVFLIYFVVLAARPFTSSTRNALLVAAVTVLEYGAMVAWFLVSGRLEVAAGPLDAVLSGKPSLLDEGAKLLLLAVAGAISSYATWWNERTLRRALAAQVARDAEERDLATKLQEADKLAAVGTLAATMAHEVNNPLALIAMLAEMMQEAPLSEGQRADLKSIAREAHRTAKVVSEMLRLARPQADEGLVSLSDVADSTLNVLRPLIRRHNVHLELDLSDALPLVAGGSARLEQVVLNLAINAIQAMEQWSGPRRLSVLTGRDATHVWLEMADSGPGFPPGVRERIFERFFTTKAEGKGTGLGLWITHQIVAEQGGTIEARNSPEGGARFLLRLPALVESRLVLSA